MSRTKELNLKTYPIDELYSVAVENSFNRIKNVVCYLKIGSRLRDIWLLSLILLILMF